MLYSIAIKNSVVHTVRRNNITNSFKKILSPNFNIRAYRVSTLRPRVLRDPKSIRVTKSKPRETSEREIHKISFAFQSLWKQRHTIHVKEFTKIRKAVPDYPFPLYVFNICSCVNFSKVENCQSKRGWNTPRGRRRVGVEIEKKKGRIKRSSR